MDCITKVPNLPAEFPGLDQLKSWLVFAHVHFKCFSNCAEFLPRLEKLNGQRAAETVDGEQVRQLIFDLNAIYSAFMDWLKRRNR